MICILQIIESGFSQQGQFTHMLEVHSLLIDTESRYILNDLYITDYCVWIQSARLVHSHAGGS